MLHRPAGRRCLALLAVPLVLAACSDKKLLEKQEDLPQVRLSLRTETVKPWYGTRQTDPEPIVLKVVLTNQSPRVVDVLNRFVPARLTDPGMLSPLKVKLVNRRTGRELPIQRWDEPERPTWKDFTSLAGPEASIEGTVDLLESFPDLDEPGQYTLWAWYEFGPREQQIIRDDAGFKKGWFWQGKDAVWPWSGKIAAPPLTITLRRVAEPPKPKRVVAPASDGGAAPDAGKG